MVLDHCFNKTTTKKGWEGTKKDTIIVRPTEFMKKCVLGREFLRKVKAFIVKQRQRTFEWVGCKVVKAQYGIKRGN